MTSVDKVQDRQKLANLITQWNQDHYDLFELSAPNEVIICFFLTNLTCECHQSAESLQFKVSFKTIHR